MTQLNEFVVESQNSSLEEFRVKYGDYFLIHYAELEEFDASWAYKTNSISSSGVKTIQNLQEGIRLDDDAHRYAVYALIKNSGISNPWKERISLGRARNNDIMISDSSVSKLHCYFTVVSDRVTVQDAGSRNGTSVNHQPVEEFNPTLVRPGDTLVTGRIAFSLMTTEGFREFIKTKTQSPRP